MVRGDRGVRLAAHTGRGQRHRGQRRLARGLRGKVVGEGRPWWEGTDLCCRSEDGNRMERAAGNELRWLAEVGSTLHPNLG